MPSDDAIYVERRMDASVEEIWERTQNPDQHQRWDPRFTEIDYLPKADGEPQKFTYRTHVGGVGVAGMGESVAEADPGDHEPTSALQFWSDDPKALIEHGRGYWRYVETDDGLRFITEYNYDTRWGPLGTLVDRLAFRPLLGWATAWGFDTMALWAEDGIPPEQANHNAAVHALSRLTLAFVWVYLGLVPKLLARHPLEVELTAATIPAGVDPMTALTILGVAEVVFGLSLLLSWRWRWPLLLSAVGPPLLSVGALVARPDLLTSPFTPLVSSLALAALALTGYVASAAMPSARRCLRARPNVANEETTAERANRAGTATD